MSLSSGWFKNLSPGDTLWILSLTGNQLILVLRCDISTKPTNVNTRRQFHSAEDYLASLGYKVEFQPHSASRPYAVPVPKKTLQKLRFHGKSSKVWGDPYAMLTGPLASLRKLQESTVGALEGLWAHRKGSEWLNVTVTKAGQPVFATAEHRTQVELKSVAFVRRDFERKGWIVLSREREHVGYDLHCTRDKLELHIEVKGTAGIDPVFFMTHGEYKRVKSDHVFLLAVVTAVLASPKLATYSGLKLQQDFTFTPMLYSATPKEE